MKLYDPTSELAPTMRPRLTPPTSLDGKIVALQSIGKARSAEFLDYVEARLKARGIRTLRTAKPTNAKVAPLAVIQEIVSEADVVIQGLAD